jgi:hypothetical protein
MANEALAGDYPTPAATTAWAWPAGDSLILIRNHEMVTDTGLVRADLFDRAPVAVP